MLSMTEENNLFKHIICNSNEASVGFYMGGSNNLLLNKNIPQQHSIIQSLSNHKMTRISCIFWNIPLSWQMYSESLPNVVILLWNYKSVNVSILVTVWPISEDYLLLLYLCFLKQILERHQKSPLISYPKNLTTTELRLHFLVNISWH